MIVYGEGFSFAVKEPEGWSADTAGLASKYGVNAVFLPQAKSSRERDVTIRIRVNDKVDENTEADLKADMDGYKKQYSNARFEEIRLKHKTYKTFSKMFCAR